MIDKHCCKSINTWRAQICDVCPKMPKKLYSSHSNTTIIKTMTLVVSFYHIIHLYHVMVHVHLVMFYGETNFIYHKLILCGVHATQITITKLIAISFNLGTLN
jgi:hypothetical protein